MVTVTVDRVTEPGKALETSAPRARAKAETRERIAGTAMRLFAERGFERVSVAEVAAAAGVTEKTVFNHFPRKEDLVYSRNLVFEQALLDAVRTRPRQESFVAAVRTFLLETYAGRATRGPGVRTRATTLAGLVEASPALRTRERDILSRYADALAGQLSAELGSIEGDLRPAVLAGALVAVHQAVIQEARRGLLRGEPPTALQQRLVAAASDAFDLLDTGDAALQDARRSS